MIGIKAAMQTVRYWQGTSWCECESDRPIGACLKCDMDELMDFLKSLNDEFRGGCKPSSGTSCCAVHSTEKEA